MGRENYVASIVNAMCIHYEAKAPKREQPLHKLVQATPLEIRSWWIKFTIMRVMQVMGIQVIVMQVVASIVILFGV